MKSTIIFLFLLIAVTACGSMNGDSANDKSNTKIIEVSLKGDNPTSNLPIKFSSLYDSSQLVALETRSDAMVSEIANIRVVNDYIFISDLSLKVFVFDMQGRFVSKVDRRGRGHGEYVTLDQFAVNPNNNNISVLCTYLHKIFVYSLKGDFLYQIAFSEDDYPRDFAELENGDYLFYTPDYNRNSRRGLWQVDSKGEYKRHLVSIDDDFRYGGLYPKYLGYANDSTVTLMGGEDYNRIYHITKDSVSVKYRLKVDLKMEEGVLNGSINLSNNDFPSRAYTKNSYFETDNWMLVNVTDMQMGVSIYYDKKSDEVYYISSEDDYALDVDITFPRTITSTSNALIGYVPAYVVQENESAEKLRARFPELTRDSNPIIVINHIK